MDHGSRPGEQPVVWHVADEQDVVTGGSEPSPAGLDDGAQAGPFDGGRDDVAEPLVVVRDHAAEPDEHRRGTGPQEVDELIGGLPSRRAGRRGRAPVSGGPGASEAASSLRSHRRRSRPISFGASSGRTDTVLMGANTYRVRSELVAGGEPGTGEHAVAPTSP
jgi:hypothetical protein